MTAGVAAQSPIHRDTIRVLVVDDHRTVADAVALALAGEDGLECVGAAHSASEARSLAQSTTPDVIVMDVNLGDGDGIEVAAELTRCTPGLRVIVLTAFVDQALLRRAAEAGAVALLPKDGTLTELLAAVRASSGDGLVVHPRVLRRLMGSVGASAPPRTHLTAREQDVLSLLAEGMDAQRIAARLGITVLTCRGYLKNVMAKLDAHSQLEAVVSARRLGLIRAPGRG